MPNTPRQLSCSNQHPLIGWMKGTVVVEPGVDLTKPAHPHWGKAVDGDLTRDDVKDEKL